MGVYEPAYKARCMVIGEFWVTRDCSYVGWCIVDPFFYIQGAAYSESIETIVSISQQFSNSMYVITVDLFAIF